MQKPSPAELQSLQQEFDNASPQRILKWAVDTYGQQLALVTSFQITGIVTLHMLREITDTPQVLTIDTGFLFPETYDLIEQVESHFDVHINRVQSNLTIAQQAVQHGSQLWTTDPNQCCYLRKTVTLTQALSGYDAWLTGLRRDQSPTRANTPVIDWDDRYNLIKICPFATWTEDMLWTYIHAHELPYNPLHDCGYASIGCYPCTRAAAGRDGRWQNFAKTECGIHMTPVGENSNAV